MINHPNPETKSIPSGKALKGIVKDELLNYVTPEFNVKWLRTPIPSGKAIIDDDYTLYRSAPRVHTQNMIIYTEYENAQFGIDFQTGIFCFINGGVPPYSISWTTSQMIISGQGTTFLQVSLDTVPRVYSFTVRVTDSLGVVGEATGSIDLRLKDIGMPIPPPETKPPDRLEPYEELKVQIYHPEDNWQVLNEKHIKGNGSPITIRLVADATGGFQPYKYKWNFTGEYTHEDITSGEVLITLDNGYGRYIASVSAEDDEMNLGTARTTIYYADQNGKWEFENPDFHEGTYNCSKRRQNYLVIQERPAVYSIDFGTGTGQCGLNISVFDGQYVGGIMVVHNGNIVFQNYYNSILPRGTVINFNKPTSYPNTMRFVLSGGKYAGNGNTPTGALSHFTDIRPICPTSGYVAGNKTTKAPLRVVSFNSPLYQGGVMPQSAVHYPFNDRYIISFPFAVTGGDGEVTLSYLVSSPSRANVFRVRSSGTAFASGNLQSGDSFTYTVIATDSKGNTSQSSLRIRVSL